MSQVAGLPLRFRFLPLLHEAHTRDGWLSREAVETIARQVRIPLAEAWEAATSFPEFRFAAGGGDGGGCGGLSCVVNGAPPSESVHARCRFRCFEAPVSGGEDDFPEEMIRLAGRLLAPDITGWDGLRAASSMGSARALDMIDRAGIRGRGGAYFPAARKWRAALGQGRPLALVINAEEGEPGVFKDRAVLCRRPRRFVEGLAIAVSVLRPAVTVIFINGEAAPARRSVETVIAGAGEVFPGGVEVVPGGGGYVLGEETTLLNALEGRKPAPRLRPPYPVESGLFGMPTVVNNVETIANLSILFREGEAPFLDPDPAAAGGSKLFSVSGRVARPGLYEMPLGTPLRVLLAAAGEKDGAAFAAVLAGGPSGGFLPASEFHRRLVPGLLHPTGAVTGSGGMVVLDTTSDLRAAVLETARFNARESCGKCTPCREGLPRVVESLAEGHTEGLDDLLEVVGAASLCGLGQMAPGPIRSARHFWPELFS
ncbi:MAG: hypothetical protein C0506_00410 [Anaerolinea sp.]|nr:hypothetical protein [Anaerolinea sp.]